MVSDESVVFVILCIAIVFVFALQGTGSGLKLSVNRSFSAYIIIERRLILLRDVVV